MNTNKRFLISMAIFLLLGLIMYLTATYFPAWIVPVGAICMIAYLIWVITATIISFRRKDKNENMELYNYIFPGKFSKYGKKFYIITIILLLSAGPLLKYTSTGLNFFSGRIEKEVIVKKFDSNNQLIETKN